MKNKRLRKLIVIAVILTILAIAVPATAEPCSESVVAVPLLLHAALTTFAPPLEASLLVLTLVAGATLGSTAFTVMSCAESLGGPSVAFWEDTYKYYGK